MHLQAAGEHLAETSRTGRVRAAGGLPSVGACLFGRGGRRARQHFCEGPWGACFLSSSLVCVGVIYVSSLMVYM